MLTVLLFVNLVYYKQKETRISGEVQPSWKAQWTSKKIFKMAKSPEVKKMPTLQCDYVVDAD